MKTANKTTAQVMNVIAKVRLFKLFLLIPVFSLLRRFLMNWIRSFLKMIPTTR